MVAGAALALGVGAAHAQAGKPAGPRIFHCGKQLSDRPASDCPTQNELNSDGSVKRAAPPPPTEAEKEAEEQRKRAAEVARAAERARQRSDNDLLRRYPNRAAHDLRRREALEDSSRTLKAAQDRIAKLQAERKPLLDEAEFYVGKPLPLKLRLAMDKNDAELEASNKMVATQKDEVGRINANYDAELEHLRQLWATPPRH